MPDSWGAVRMHIHLPSVTYHRILYDLESTQKYGNVSQHLVLILLEVAAECYLILPRQEQQQQVAPPMRPAGFHFRTGLQPQQSLHATD